MKDTTDEALNLTTPLPTTLVIDGVTYKRIEDTKSTTLFGWLLVRTQLSRYSCDRICHFVGKWLPDYRTSEGDPFDKFDAGWNSCLKQIRDNLV